MLKKLTPHKFVKKFWEITPEILLEMDAKVVIVDLDGTMVSKNIAVPTKEVLSWIKAIKAEGIEFLILSNNKKSRVEKFSKDIGVPFMWSARKPLNIGLSKIKKSFKEGVKPENVVVIGDQIYTDAWLAKRNGYQSIYVYPIDDTSTYSRIRLNFTEKSFLKGVYDG